jgi:1,4-dihydroxy-2-naphthoyl-CoA hydrolase
MSTNPLQELIDIATHDGPLPDALAAWLNTANQGLDPHLGIRYTAITREQVAAELPVAEHLLQPAGLVNGGVFAALAESVGSLAGVIAAGAPVVGVNNSTDFIAGVSQGVIEATTAPIQTGRRTQLWEITMRNEGRLVARTTLRTMVMDQR